VPERRRPHSAANRVRRRQKRPAAPSRLEFLQLQIDQLRVEIDNLKRGETWQMKRCAELQVEIDALKKLLNLHRG
jgi:hypothetical protein